VVILEEMERMVNKGYREIRVSLAKKVQLVHLEYQDHQELKEIRVLLGKLVYPDRKVHQE